ncbi:TAP-like protein-domain-containing protein [Hypoxylon crocopeplum]|nr:TAP-like protein-domain-containing protein [Hypoxylon crocopeplum]
MVSIKALAPLLSLAAQATSASIRRDYPTGIQWGPCKLNTTLPVQCAKLTVPLDYTNKSGNTTLDLDLIKYPAQKQPKRGSIILNFGGPGQDGLTSMLEYAELMGPTTGGYHDLVSWDPRGTGSTLRFSCWPNDTTGYFDSMGAKLAGSADSAAGTLWAQGEIIANQCYTQLKETGELVGMAFAARDMMSIVDALGEDGKLRYWGISGGTTMGATVAAMFPDRMDRVVLDGVMNAHEYYNSYGEPQMVASGDGVFDEFIRGCLAAGPSKCALSHNQTFAELESTLLSLFTTLRDNPPVYAHAYVVEYSPFKSYVYNALYRPRGYPALAQVLADMARGDFASYAAALTAPPLPAQDQAILGIRCGDKGPRTDDFADLTPVFDEYRATSKWFWDWGWGYYVAPCAQWRTRARERYDGDFHVATSSPLLFVGNSFDPVTPLVSARNMSAGFEGSVVLTHDAHGHTSLAQPSNCTNAIIQNYFLEGKMPTPKTVCKPNLPLFAPGA